VTVIESKPKERRKAKAEVLVRDDDTAMVPMEEITRPSVQIVALNDGNIPELEASVDDDDETLSRRDRARKRFNERRVKEEKELEEEEAKKIDDLSELPDDADQQMMEAEQSEEEEEYLLSSRPMLKPTFISKKDRGTIVERQKMEEEEIAYEEAKVARVKERKVESKVLAFQEVQREEDMRLKGIGDAEDQALPDDTDGLNEEEDLEMWKIRELRRLKRDRELQEQIDQEHAELEARRNMTDEHIMELNSKDPKQQKDKGQFRFLQKYYHKGAFYLSEDEVFHRDFTAPTGADKTVDRGLLPDVLQVKKFGLKGRTKYTHLTHQDTTRKEANPWAQTESLHQRPHRLAGHGSIKPERKTTKQ